jgi:uncharacterized membrane protein
VTVGQEIRMNILVLGQFADVLTTYIGLQKFGMREANPIAKWMFENLGFTNSVILKLGMAIFLSKHAGSLSCAITWTAPINNIIGMLPE